MSSIVYKIIPTNPEYIPEKSKLDAAIRFLRTVHGNALIDITISDQIEFVDQGANFESLSCNLCKKPIDIEYWQSKMDESYQTHFQTLIFLTPCCNQISSLNDLYFSTPAGFSKFVICLRDPTVEIDSKQLHSLNELLETSLKTICARY